MVDVADVPAFPATRDPARLAALAQTGVLDEGAEEAFDRIARLAERLLDVPVVLVSFIDEDRQRFKSVIGLAEPWASARETPLDYSFCRYSVTTGAPVVVDDSRNNALVSSSPAIDELGVAAYAGYPITTSEGYVLGNLCVIDSVPRQWLDWELDLLGELTGMVTTEVRYRRKQRALADVESAVLQLQRPVEALGDAVRSVVSTADTGGERQRRLDVLADRSARVETTVADLVAAVRTGGPALSDTDDRVDLIAQLQQAADLATRSGAPERVVLDVPSDPVVVGADPTVLARALSHLLVTGLLHATDGADVTVRVECEDERVRLAAVLPGGALAAAELSRLVTRFHHALAPGEESEASLRSSRGQLRAEDPPVVATTGPSGTELSFETRLA